MAGNIVMTLERARKLVMAPNGELFHVVLRDARLLLKDVDTFELEYRVGEVSQELLASSHPRMLEWLAEELKRCMVVAYEEFLAKSNASYAVKTYPRPDAIQKFLEEWQPEVPYQIQKTQPPMSEVTKTHEHVQYRAHEIFNAAKLELPVRMGELKPDGQGWWRFMHPTALGESIWIDLTKCFVLAEAAYKQAADEVLVPRAKPPVSDPTPNPNVTINDPLDTMNLRIERIEAMLKQLIEEKP